MTEKKKKNLVVLYLGSCTVPLLIVVAGFIWATGKQGFASWGIIRFLLFGGAVGVVNAIAGLPLLSMQGLSRRQMMGVGIGFVIGGILPTCFLLFILSQ